MRDQTEVGPLSRRVMLPLLNPYRPHYKTAFAFSVLPYPLCHPRPLRFGYHVVPNAEVGHNGLTQLTAVELRASPVGARLPVGTVDVAASRFSDSPPHVPFGHGHQPLGPFLTHERGSPFACAQPSGASLGRFCLEAGRLRPLSPELSHLPVTRDARLGRDTWTSQGLRCMIVGHTLIRVALPQRPFAGRKSVS